MSKTIGNMWYCGDEHCDCYQPQILEQFVVPDMYIKPYRVIWSGTFKSGPSYDEIKELWEELINKSKELSVDNLDRLVVEYKEIVK